MNQYIMFNKKQTGVNGYVYIANVKYKIKNEDENFYYAMGDKLVKHELDFSKYEIGNIIKAKLIEVKD